MVKIMKLLFKYFRKYKVETVLAPTFKLLEAIIDLFIPMIIALIIDKGIHGNNPSFIIKMFLLLMGCAFVGLFFSILGQYFSAKTATFISSEIRENLFIKLQNISFSQIDQIGTSTMITRMTSDINSIQTGINLSLRLLLRSPFVVFGAAIFGTIIAVDISYIFWIAILILSIIIFTIMLYGMKLHKKQQRNLDQLVSITRDNLYGVRVIRAFTREEEEIKEFECASDKLNKAQNKAAILSNLLNPFTYIIINIAIIVLIHFSIVEFKLGNLEQGDVVALYNYMGQILVELIKLANLIITITKSLASSKRIKSIFDLDDIIPKFNTSEKIDDFIKFDNVSFKYALNSEESLKNINFTINKGETIGIIGSTGSGKTTILNLIMRHYDVNDGVIYYDGKDIRNYSPDELVDKIGIALQNTDLFSGTIRENIVMGNDKVTEEEILYACRVAQCLDIINSKEKGLDSIVEQKGKNFSGGQKQRICMARAIVKKPELLIFDDSTSALDYLTDSKFRMALKKLEYNPTIIIVSQRTSSILSADKILVLEDGEQIAFDNHNNLMKNCEIYQEIYYSQFEKDGE